MMTPLKRIPPQPLLSSAADHFPSLPTGKDEASSVEVTWPDGKMASRNVASSEMNSVLEIPYPRDDDRPQDPGSLEVRRGVWTLEPNKQAPPTTLRAEAGFPGIADFVSRRMGIFLAKDRLCSNPSICSFHTTITPTALLLLKEILACWKCKHFYHPFYREGKLRPRKRTHQNCSAICEQS